MTQERVYMECPPDCKAALSEKLQNERHGDITKRLDGITGNQEKIIDALGAIGGLLANVNNLTNNFEDFRTEARKHHEEIFIRLRAVEANKADKSEVHDMQKTGLSWVWQLLIMAIGMIGGFLVGRGEK